MITVLILAFCLIVLVIAWLINYVLIAPAFLLDILLLSFSIRIVKPNRAMTVEFLGKYTRILRQWFHAIIPFIERTTSQDLFRKNFSVEVQWVTADNVTAAVWLNVVYYVHDDNDDSRQWNIYKSVYSIDSPETFIYSIIDEELRWMMFHFTHKEIFWKRSEIGKDIESALRDKLAEYGYRIDSIQVREINLDKWVMAAMNMEIESEKKKNATYNQAEAEKIRKVKDAEADKESQILLWQGMAWQRMEIAKWFKDAIDSIRAADENLWAKDILNFLLDSSRIETLERIGWDSKSKLVYLNENLEWRTSARGFESKLLSGSDIMSE